VDATRGTVGGRDDIRMICFTICLCMSLDIDGNRAPTMKRNGRLTARWRWGASRGLTGCDPGVDAQGDALFLRWSLMHPCHRMAPAAATTLVIIPSNDGIEDDDAIAQGIQQEGRSAWQPPSR